MRSALLFLTVLSIVPLKSDARLFHQHRPHRPAGAYVHIPRPSTDEATLDAADQCVDQDLNCDQNAAYRTIDGSCNNLAVPWWGQANTALTRLAPAQFQDGVNEPRKAVSGNDLPSAREIVISAYSFVENINNVNTLALMSVGQLLSHDASSIGAPLIFDDKCCNEGGSECINIPVPNNDPYYAQYNVTCLPMFRTPTTESIGCPLAPQYTMTSVTHFIDASFVYGSSSDLAASLREKSGGRLKADTINSQPYPPHNSDAATFCYNNETAGDLCMQAGDNRANQNPPLSALQVIFFREHNRLANALAALNPDWDDEKLYQEARRILIAEWQIIIYRDYLHNIIGPETVKAAGLLPDLQHMSSDYDQFMNPSTTNDFTSAAFRVFHSLVTDAYCQQGGQSSATGCPMGANKFSNTFDNPNILTSQDGFRSVLAALNRQNAAKVDNTVTVEISGKMFHRERSWGLDLISADINRGRDVGLPNYNQYRSLCGMQPAKTWSDLSGVFDHKALNTLQSLYESPDDVDVYVAGSLERKFAKAIVGPTFECILVDQFKRWRTGDRYFVDFKGFAHSFTPEQTRALSRTSLARLFCDNGDGIETIPRDIFRLLSERVPCRKIPKVDLMPWRT